MHVLKYVPRFVTVLSALLAAATPRIPASTPGLPQFQRASGLCQVAEKAMRVGNLKKARESLVRALAIWPSLSAAHMGMGHIALTEKRFEDALTEYRLAKDSYADMGEALLQLRVQSFSDAKEEIVMLQDSIRAQERLAPSSVRLHRLQAAIERLQAMDPPSRQGQPEPPGEIDFYIGNALFHLNRLDEAVEAWQACVRRSRGFSFAYQNLAVGYWMEGRLPEARQTIDAAERLGFKVDPELKAKVERDRPPRDDPRRN